MWFTVYHMSGPNMLDQKVIQILPVSIVPEHRTQENFLLQPLAEAVFSSIFKNMQSLRDCIQPFL